MEDKEEPMLERNDNARLEAKRTYQDLPAAMLFLTHLAAVAAIAITYATRLAQPTQPQRPPTPGSAKHARAYLALLATSTLVAAALAAGWMLLLRSGGSRMLIYSGATSVIALGAVQAATLLFSGGGAASITLGILALGLSLGCAAWIGLNRHRVELSVQLLSTVAELMHAFPSLVKVSVSATAIQIAWQAGWCATFAYAYEGGAPPAALLFLLFSFFWTSQLVRAVMHATVAGVIGTWYFHSPNVPPQPTQRALRRALTTSLGSLCFGALVAAPLQVLRAVARRASGAGAPASVRSLGLCLLGFVDVLVRFFNDFAYTQVAIYGKHFTLASWDTWTLLVRHSGVDALMQRDMVGSALALGAAASGLLTSLIAAYWARAVFGVSTALWWQTYLVTFWIGYVAVAAASAAVDAGVIALYVCYAEDPTPLAALAPDLYTAFIAHPHVPGYSEHVAGGDAEAGASLQTRSVRPNGGSRLMQLVPRPAKQPYSPLAAAADNEPDPQAPL